MKTWGTTIYALDPVSKEHRKFGGPNIQAPTRQLAHEFCQNNGLGYCHIQDEVVMEIDAETGEITDFEAPQNN